MNTNKEKIKQFKTFFKDQVAEAISDQQKINKSSMCRLFKTGDLSLAYAESVQYETGLVIMKFPHGMTPRLKVQKSVTVIKKNAHKELGERPTEWKCLWEDFCKNLEYHSAGSDVTPMYFVQREENGYDYVACAGISLKLSDLFVKSTSKGKSLPVLIYNPFPPVEYYQNLCAYLDMFPDNEELYMEPHMSYEDWVPEELSFNEGHPNAIPDKIQKTLEEENYCIMQGPPGTGKSYTIATIIASYLEAGKNVCATTMANKGLVELIRQKPLEKYRDRIYKTHLSIDESKLIGGVKDSPFGLLISKGELLCSTNYVLSGVFKEKNISRYGIPKYDLVVIEEASQAFLTTIAAFKQLGTRCLIVGDPMQLPPIVNMNNPLYKSWNINVQIDGLTTFILCSVIKSYRIVTTFRLTPRSAALTKLFYSNNFSSVRKNLLDFSLFDNPLFPSEGGDLYCCTNDVRNSIYSQKADKIIRSVVETVKKYYPDRSLAIISPFVDSVKELQKRFSSTGEELDITIETIDRIQGMTVDYAILYIPGRNPSFALEKRRFNVATSRSLSTTLIISDAPLCNFQSVSTTVLRFVDGCDKVDSSNLTVKKQNHATDKCCDTLSSAYEKVEVKVVDKIDLSKFERSQKELKAGMDNCYLIDTNVFIDCPDIVSKIDKKYPVILSAKVVDELDKLKIKLDEKGKRNAEKALFAINNEHSHEIKYECADVSLLPCDFKQSSPDNMILSIALKYRKKGENPIMLTSDNGLQIKSKMLNISTVSLKNFLRRYI